MTKPNPFAHLVRSKQKAPASSPTPLAPSERAAADLAKQIIRAAAKARGEIPSEPQTIARRAPTQMTAEGIIDAAKKRDQGGSPLAEPTGTAAAIVAAGAKRRNLGKG